MITEEKLYEMDRDELIQELVNKTGINIVGGYYSGRADMYVNSQCTADGYEIYTITGAYDRRTDWECDVFYYEPSAEAILSRFEELDEGDTIEIEELEWLDQDEGAIIDYLLLNFSEEYDEIHEIIEQSGE